MRTHSGGLISHYIVNDSSSQCIFNLFLLEMEKKECKYGNTNIKENWNEKLTKRQIEVNKKSMRETGEQQLWCWSDLILSVCGKLSLERTDRLSFQLKLNSLTKRRHFLQHGGQTRERNWSPELLVNSFPAVINVSASLINYSLKVQRSAATSTHRLPCSQ